MRPKRRKELSPEQVNQYLRAATAYHRALVQLCMELKPGSAHYQAIQSHHIEIIAVIRALSGDEPPWMRVTRAR